MMRTLKCVVAAMGLMTVLLASGETQAGSRIRADDWFWRYPNERWCLGNMDGVTECAYPTFQQCNVARAGVGGNCNVNPRYVEGVPVRSAKTRRYVR
jgi:hypothetical protein